MGWPEAVTVAVGLIVAGVVAIEWLSQRRD